MLSETQRLQNFQDAINSYALEQRKKTEDEIKEQKEARLKQAEAEVLSEAYRMIQAEMADMRHKITREMAQRESEAKKRLLAKRAGMTADVFSRAEKKLLEFSKSEEYKDFLMRHAKKAAEMLCGRAEVSVKPGDEMFFPLLREAFGADCTLKTDDTVSLGGFYAENRDKGLYIDATLDAMLTAQLEWFEENSGLRVV